jgi:hypothetical protein
VIESVTSQSQTEAANMRLSSNPAIRALIARISARAKEPDNGLIDIAKDVALLRRHVEAERLTGGETWYQWAPKNLDVGGKDKLFLFHKLTEAKDRKQAERILGVYRQEQAERARRYRERQRHKFTAMAEDRRALIKWTEKAPLREVSKVLTHVRSVFETR